MNAEYMQSNTFDLAKHEWEELSLKKREQVIECNEHFLHLGSKFDVYQPIPHTIIANTYWYQI